MKNPLLNLMQSSQAPQQMGGMMPMLQQFMQFKNQFQGDPKQKVMEMLNSGQITQQQFEQATNMAKQLESMFTSMK